MKWGDVLSKQEGLLYGPDNFQAVLRAQEIDPYSLDVSFHDFEKIFDVFRKSLDSRAMFGGGMINFLHVEDLKTETRIAHTTKIRIAEIMGITYTSQNEEQMVKILLVYVLYVLGTYITDEAQHYREKDAVLSNQFSIASISWGTQHAFWHIVNKGKNTREGQRLRSLSQVHIENMQDRVDDDTGMVDW